MSDEPHFGMDDAQDQPAQDTGEGEPDLEQVGFEIEFFEPVMEHCPDFVEVLQLMGSHYTRVGRCQDGLAVDRRLVRLCPDDAIAHYNLACSLSLTDKPVAAVRELDRAISLGYRYLAHMDRDPDLDKLRKHPAYLRLMRRLRGS